MSITHINTSKSCIQSTTRKISTISKEISNGKRISFRHSADIIIGNIHNINHLMYTSADQGLKNVVSLLNHSQSSLNEMSNAIQELHGIYISASTQTLSQSELDVLEVAFQTQIRNLDQIATTAKYGSISLLDGSIDNTTPLQIHTPNGDILDIIISNMTNAGSPISNPSEDEPHIKIRSTMAIFQAAIDIPIGDADHVLDNIKAFCGKDAFLYIVADQIDKAFTTGLAVPGGEYATCLAQLQALNWDALLKPSDAAAARALIANPAFSTNPGNTIDTTINLIGVFSQDRELYETMEQAIVASYVPDKYVAQASPELSISSPDYFEAVGARIKIAMNYIAGTQMSVNQQIKYVEGMRVMHFEYADQSDENSNKYLKVDLLQASSELNNLIASQSLVIAATIGFCAKLNSTISEASNRILQR